MKSLTARLRPHSGRADRFSFGEGWRGIIWHVADESRVMVLETEEILDRGFFRVVSIRFTYQRFDGTRSGPVQRLVFQRGDSVAMVLHDLVRDEVILVEQLRIPTLEHGGWIFEIPAGTIDGSDSPEATAHREIYEETGAPPGELALISSFYGSPGACSERIHLFYAPYPEGLTLPEYAGLAVESEDIKVWRKSPAEAMAMVQEGRIVDAKTIIGLQWLKSRSQRSAWQCPR